MHFITSLIHLSIAVALGGNQVKAADSGYIVAEFPSIPCQHLPSDNACSSLDYKIPDLSKIPGVPDLSKTRQHVPTVAKFLRSTGSEACSQSGTKYYCSLVYPFRCEGDYVKVDVKKIEAMCNTGKSDCSTLNATILNSVFSCSGVASKFGGQQQIKRKFTCDVFPEVKNDAYECAVNYKVFAENKTMFAERISFIHTMLKKHSKTIDGNCETSVADAVCKAAIPACSKDRTKLVSIMSKQDCYKTVGCVSKTKNAELIEGAHKMCQNLPDSGKAKKISLDNVYDGKAANNVMAFSTTLMIALVVAQRFI